MIRTTSKSKKRPSKSSDNGVQDFKEVMTLDEAAAYLRISADEVMRSVDVDGLPGRKVGNDWRFFKRALQDWLSQPVKKGILRHAGKIKGDPFAEEMLREIYAQRGRPETEEECCSSSIRTR